MLDKRYHDWRKHHSMQSGVFHERRTPDARESRLARLSPLSNHIRRPCSASFRAVIFFAVRLSTCVRQSPGPDMTLPTHTTRDTRFYNLFFHAPRLAGSSGSVPATMSAKVSSTQHP